jgi:hypothetical protein
MSERIEIKRAVSGQKDTAGKKYVPPPGRGNSPKYHPMGIISKE